MINKTKFLFLLSALFLCSCKPSGGVGGATGTSSTDADYNRLTNNGTTFPSTYDVTGHVGNTLSGPTGGGTCPLPEAPVMQQGAVSSGSSKDLCDIAGTTRPWQKNCKALLKKKGFPRNAFIHALKSMKMNASSFRSKKCYQMASPSHYSMKGLNKSKFEGLLSKGIPNKCQMMINNFDERIKSHSNPTRKCKTASYYIDLCSSSPKVQKSFSYVGYGTCKSGRGFVNKAEQGTSLLGTFLTSNKEFDFQKRKDSYGAIAKRLGGKIPAVPLMGLQKSNSRSSKDLKYLHVGAYTSAGCPSIPESNHGMISQLAKNGPSMVVNYKEGQMEDIKECSN